MPWLRHALWLQVVGLAFFAVLLTQINAINDVIGEKGKVLVDQKNEVIQFMKTYDLDDDVVMQTIHFL